MGDLYLTLPFINALKRTFGEESTDIIVSENIYGHFKNKKYLFNNIFSYPKKNIIKKIFLLIKLRKQMYDQIIVFDGKDRSIIFSYFLKSLRKIIFVEKRKIKFLIKKAFLNNKKIELIYNNKIDTYYKLYKNIINKCGAEIKEGDFKFLKYNKLDSLDISFFLENKINDYTIIHLDEKWFSKYYIKEYTDISPTCLDFVNLIKKIIDKTNKNIIITTGIIHLPFLDKLKNEFFKKINNDLFALEYNNSKIIILLNSSVNEIETLIMNSKNLITCNSSLRQIAGSFNINLIDIIEKDLETWYMRHVFHIKNILNYLEKILSLYQKTYCKKLINEILRILIS